MSKKFNIDIREINEEFVKEYFRKEYIIDNYNVFNDVKYEVGEKLKKKYNNDLLEDTVEKIFVIANGSKMKKVIKSNTYQMNHYERSLRNFLKTRP